MVEVKLSLMPPVRAGVCADPEWMVRFALHAESLGFESIVTVEHPLVIGTYSSRYPYAESGRMPLPDDCEIPDPIDTLAFVAGATKTIGLSTGLVVLPAHHPVVMAKRLATVDRLSQGRLRLCIGLGWMREEIEACGADFETRGRRADESIDVMRTLWAQSGPAGASFDGEFFRFSNAYSYPKPFPRERGRGIPIHIGGHSKASVLRAARRGDGWHPLGIEGQELGPFLDLLGREASAAGRDPSEIEITLSGVAATTDLETLEEVKSWGGHRMVLACLKKDIERAKEEISELAARVDLQPRP